MNAKEAVRQEEIKTAYEFLKRFRNKRIYATVKSVSRSGMSRRIEFFSVLDGEIVRIGWYMSKINGYKYDSDLGMHVGGCGMDMIFHVISNFNYWAAQHDTGKTLTELMQTKECGERIYDEYFFDANNYGRL